MQTNRFHSYRCDRKSSSQQLFLVPLIGGRRYIITQLAVYTTYIPLIYCLLGGLYATYHLLREPGNSIDPGAPMSSQTNATSKIIPFCRTCADGCFGRAGLSHQAGCTQKDQLEVWKCCNLLSISTNKIFLNMWFGDIYQLSQVSNEKNLLFRDV